MYNDRMINSYINRNYYRLYDICKKYYSGSDMADIFNECLLMILEKDNEKISKLISTNDFDRYFIQMFINNASSPTAPYQWKYNKFQNRYIILDILEFENNIFLDGTEPLKYIDLDIGTLLFELDSVEWIYKLIFMEYISKKVDDRSYSFRKMAVEGEFSENILSNRYNIVRDEIRKKINGII